MGWRRGIDPPWWWRPWYRLYFLVDWWEQATAGEGASRRHRGLGDVMARSDDGSSLTSLTPAGRSSSAAMPTDQDPLFAEFWAAYPRKVSKGGARRQWRVALRRKADPRQIIAAAERFRDECGARGTPKDYIPHPTSWLSNERYADEPSVPQNATAPAVAAPSAGRLNDEQLLAAVIRLCGDHAQPVTAARVIIDAVRSQAGTSAPGGAVTVTAGRGRELAAMPYQDYLQTPEWQERRKAALRQAGSRCQVCNRSRTLHVHHRTYERRGTEMPADLTVLCDECHALFHGKGLIPAEPAA
jgi:hypothetical protein